MLEVSDCVRVRCSCVSVRACVRASERACVCVCARARAVRDRVRACQIWESCAGGILAAGALRGHNPSRLNPKP